PPPVSFVFTRSGGNLNAALTAYYTVSGTATRGPDYAGLVPNFGTGTVNFAPGQAVVTAPITPINDGLVENDETIVVSLLHNELPGQSWAAGQPNGVGFQAVVLLRDGAPAAGPNDPGTGLTGKYYNQSNWIDLPSWKPNLTQTDLTRI